MTAFMMLPVGCSRISHSVRQVRQLSFETLERRELFCSNALPPMAGEPTGCEQYMLELVNLARANGAEEASRNGLAAGLQEGPPSIFGEAWTIQNTVQPLAWSKQLKNAAAIHAADLNNADQFFLGGSPHTFGGTTPEERITSAGYQGGPYIGPTTASGYRPGGENVAMLLKSPISGYSDSQLSATVLDAHINLFNDTGPPPIAGRGHRNTLMLGAFREFGVSVVTGTDNSIKPGSPSPDWDSVYIVQEFGIPFASTSFLTGVVYNDNDNSLNDANKRLGFTPGEGLGNVTITAVPSSGGAAITTTSFSSGGYSLELVNGEYAVTASGPFGTTSEIAVVISGINRKIDFVNPTGLIPEDVNSDGTVAPLDALLVINHLNKTTSSEVPIDRPQFDVNRDLHVTPLDALIVINYLNRAG